MAAAPRGMMRYLEKSAQNKNQPEQSLSALKEGVQDPKGVLPPPSSLQEHSQPLPSA